MMSINNNPFKLKENTTTTTTTNSTINHTNTTPTPAKTRPAFIPNENILKKASLFNNFNNNNNGNNNNNNKPALKTHKSESTTKTPLAKLKTNGINKEKEKDKEVLNEQINNHESENNSFDATDTNSTSSSDVMSNTSNLTKDNLLETKTNSEKEDDIEDYELKSDEHRSEQNDDQIYDINIYRRKLAEEQYLNKQLKLENDTLHEELQDIRHEMEELQDQFRLDDADEFRQLQAELEIAAKNCRILQFKLRKLEKKNESLETEKIMLQDKLDEFSRETGKLIDLEEELLIAKEVSIRLHGELEQAQEWRITTENLNKELKKQLDELKDHLDNEIRSRNVPNDHNELVLVNKLYESMFREYFMQEQLYTMSNNLQTQNVSKQLREVTDLLSSYQQKIAILNDELNMIKQQSASKDREMDSMRLQLKNLKRSKSQDSSNDRNNRNSNTSNDSTSEETSDRKSRSMSVDNSSETLSRQVEIGKDELRLLKNKIMRLEDDLAAVTQERDSLLSQLEKIEDKAMKSFETLPDTDPDLELESNFVEQMTELKNRIDELNSEAKQNDETRTQLSFEIQQLRDKLDDKLIETEKKESLSENHDNDQVKNLTDSDKLLRDEYKLVKNDLDEKIKQISKLELDLEFKNQTINQLKTEIDLKQTQLKESTQNEREYNDKYVETNFKLNELGKQIDDYEHVITELKTDLDSKKAIEFNLRTDSTRLNASLNDFSAQLKDKLSEIEFLNKENNALQERINTDEAKNKLLTNELQQHKHKIELVNIELSTKTLEFNKFETLIKSKENELNEANKKLIIRDQVILEKVKECELCRRDLNELKDKYSALNSSTDDKLKKMNDEIDSLSAEKDKLYNELVDLSDKHNQCASKNAELDQEKQALKKLETQALNAKYEMKIQYLEIEIDTLRSKIRKLLKEKEVQDQILKENQLIVKEIALKYTTDSDTWNRQKQKLLEKEKLYEESVDMRKELKKAADKLRQKLQSLEEQIIDKQNKHTIEKNNWETQRIQYITTNNRLEEQLSKLSTLKRSKKEIEFAWDKERREMSEHIQNLEEFIKALQLQLTQRNSSMAQVNDQYGQNEKIQSLFGENEFLKNRIKELEVMLDEMEQVKRFLFDVKEAYDADRHEWMLAKEEFRYQLEIKENLWLECNMRLNQMINVIQAIQANEPLPANLFDENNSIDDTNSTNDSLLNNLVGGTSNLLEFKLGASQRNLTMASKQNSISSQNQPLENSRNLSSSKMNISNLRAINEQGTNRLSLDEENLALIDITKDRKELNTEFDQAFKKMNRVKDNYGTHKKFMDIVKSKSMKALNRKSSTASLPQHELLNYQPNGSHESRGSVPPEFSNNKMAAIQSQRAKSVTKEPIQRGDSQTSQTSQKSTTSSIFTAPSRFFSLSRIRSRFSSQPPPPIPTSSPSATHLAPETFEQNENETDFQDKSRQQHTTSPVQIQITQQPIDDKSAKKKENVRERALSPGRILRSLRPRSPFTRTGKPNLELPANIITTTVGPTSTNKSFTVSSSMPNETQIGEHIDRRQYLQNSSYQSNSISSNVSEMSSNNRSVRANTAGPAENQSRSGFAFLSQTLASDKLRSASCEFIDNNNASFSGAMNRLDETLDEVDESVEKANQISQKTIQKNPSPQPPPLIQVTENTPPTVPSNRSRKPNIAAFGAFNVSTSSQSSRIEALKKTFDNVSQDKSDIVKSVKFKEPEKTKQEPSADLNLTPTKKQAPPPPPPSSSFATTALKINTKTQETKLMQVLDDAMLSSPSTVSSISSTSQNYSSMNTPNILITSDNEDKLGSLNSNSRRLNVKFGGQTSLDENGQKMTRGLLTASNTKLDKMPPKAPTSQNNTLATNISNAFSFRNKFTGLKAKTLDNSDTASQNFAEYQSSTNNLNKPISGNNNNSSNSNINNQNTPILTSNGKPIQSILRRSETPPNKNLRQSSIESNVSHRETSIEKILLSKTSTSRPLMFNEKK